MLTSLTSDVYHKNALKLSNLKLIMNLKLKFSHLLINHTLRKYSSSNNSIKMAFTHYKSEECRKPPLIIMHGFLGSKRNWNALGLAYTKKTTPQRDVYLVDVRNHGDSPHTDVHDYSNIAEDIKEFYREHHLEKASLLGHSMGGRAVMYFALKHPELVEKLIIGDISPISVSEDIKTIPNLLNIMQNVSIPADTSAAIAKKEVGNQLSQKIDSELLRMFLMTNLKINTQGNLQWQINIPILSENYTKMARFPEITESICTCPALFVYGGKSDYMKEADHDQILKIFPDAQFECITDAGHWLHFEKPAEFLRITSSFLNRLK